MIRLLALALLLGLPAWVPVRGQDFQPLAYAPAPVDNPLKGFVPYDSIPDHDIFPHSLEWFYLPLASLMPAEHTFDWRPLEKHLDGIAGHGRQAALRIYLDFPGKESGIPQFLLEGGLATHRYDDRRNFGKSPSPDYEDPKLRAVLQEFIAAFGAKYDGDPRIGFITLGLLGHWGEWHTGSRPTWFASKAVQLEVMHGYLRAFHRTRLLVRYPAGTDDRWYADNQDLPLGYHDDSFAWATLPTGQAKDSWFFMDRMIKAGATDKWRTRPIGGEVRPEVWDTLWNDPTGAPKGQEYLPCVEATHATWMMNTGVFRAGLTGERRDRALEGARRLGYELQVAAAAIAVGPAALTVKARVINRGVAPFYYAWPIQLGLADATGKIRAAWHTDWDLTRIEPGAAPVEFAGTVPRPALPPGVYQVVVCAPNPLPNGHPLRFANAAQDQAVPGWLTLGSVRL